MGLGKTVISLTAIADLLFDSFEAHRVLVVAPLRVARDTWPAEIEKWEHLQHLTFSVVVGTPKERRAALMADADITIINRENLQWLIEDSGFPFTYDMVCIDELSSFKNHINSLKHEIGKCHGQHLWLVSHSECQTALLVVIHKQYLFSRLRQCRADIVSAGGLSCAAFSAAKTDYHIFTSSRRIVLY